MKDRIFFQDFLFRDLPVDEKESPKVCVCYINRENLTGTEKLLSFDRLLRMNKEEEWVHLLTSLKGLVVIIEDDIKLKNTELEEYKKLYMKTYYYNISRYCKKCYVRSCNQ